MIDRGKCPRWTTVQAGRYAATDLRRRRFLSPRRRPLRKQATIKINASTVLVLQLRLGGDEIFVFAYCYLLITAVARHTCSSLHGMSGTRHDEQGRD